MFDGNVFDLEVYCFDYEVKIKVLGGINFFLVGIGEDGYIVFNEFGLSLVFCICVKIFIYDIIFVNSCFFGNDVGKVFKMVLIVGV